jgi:hypothetical protein
MTTAIIKARAANWRDYLPVHPAAELFPMMSGNELRELADDIKKNGLREAIVLYDGPETGTCVLDGRNRLDALELIGRETANTDGVPASSIFTTQHARRSFDPYAYVLSKNLHRRHLTAEQKRDVIAKVLKANPETSNREIAKQAKASHVTVGAIRRELESTGQIDQLEKTTGKDGKERPAKRKPAAQQVFASPQEAHGKADSPKPSDSQANTREIGDEVIEPEKLELVAGMFVALLADQVADLVADIGDADLQTLTQAEADKALAHINEAEIALRQLRAKIKRHLASIHDGGAA